LFSLMNLLFDALRFKTLSCISFRAISAFNLSIFEESSFISIANRFMSSVKAACPSIESVGSAPRVDLRKNISSSDKVRIILLFLFMEIFSMCNGIQRGIYLTFGDTCVINSVRKAALCHQMCPERLAAKHKTSVPLVLCPRSSGA